MSRQTHPTLPKFDYVKPKSLTEASKFLAEHNKESRPLMGGTDIFVRMRDGFWLDKYLVDVKDLDGMNDLRFDPTKGLVLGAAVNMNRVTASAEVQENYPLLAEACRSVASYQLRTRATVVGNICNASPAGDTIGACLVLDGVLQIHGENGNREEPLADLFLGPGKTTLKAGDIVTAIHFRLPPEGSAGKYIKLGRNRLSDLSIVGVTAFGYPDADCASGYRFRLALASVAPVPLVVQKVEDYLSTNAIDADSIQEAARLAAESCSPIDDVRGSARYRQEMVRNLSANALTKVWKKMSN